MREGAEVGAAKKRRWVAEPKLARERYSTGRRERGKEGRERKKRRREKEREKRESGGEE